MIDIKPSDFSSDSLYTKMEELIAAREDFNSQLEGVNKDFKMVIKYLTGLQLFKSYMVANIEIGGSFGWNNEKKILEMETNEEAKNIFECKLEERISAHKCLASLLDLIICKLNEKQL